jgi:membrane protein
MQARGPDVPTGSTWQGLKLVTAYALIGLVVPSQRREAPAAADPPPLSSRQEPLYLQQIRAREPARGRGAATPAQIPWRGWTDILWRTSTEIQEHRLLALAAGVVFYGLLALFPAITALVSLYGLFAKASTIQQHLDFLSSFMPNAVVDIVDEQIGRVAAKGDVKLGLGFAIGLGLALWSANAGMKSMMDALNIVYEEDEKRGFLKLNLISLGFTVAAILSVLLAVGAIVAFPLVFARLGIPSMAGFVVEVGRWPVLALGILFALAVLYRYGPSRREPKWKWVSVGSVFAAVFWLAGSAAFSYYLAKYAHYDATYGSLGTGIGLMMWMWMTAIVVLVGGELNSEIEHQTALDTTEGRAKPLGARGATMADTVGATQS